MVMRVPLDRLIFKVKNYHGRMVGSKCLSLPLNTPDRHLSRRSLHILVCFRGLLGGRCITLPLLPIIRGVQNGVMRDPQRGSPILNKCPHLFLCLDDAEMPFEENVRLQF